MSLEKVAGTPLRLPDRSIKDLTLLLEMRVPTELHLTNGLSLVRMESGRG